MMRKTILHLLAAATMAVSAGSCRQQATGPTQQQLDSMRVADSLALHIAVIPTQDCMPIYYAERTGLFDSLGLDVRLARMDAMMDADTCLARGHVDVAYTDMARVMMMRHQGSKVQIVAGLPQQVALVTARDKRVKNLRQMKDRMIAVERHATADYWSDMLCDTAKIERSDVFRPQVNSVRVRCDMLMNNKVDAAIIPQPYIAWAKRGGNKVQWTAGTRAPWMGALAITPATVADKRKAKQIGLLLSIYNKAVDQLNSHAADTAALHRIMEEEYGMPRLVAATLKREKIEKLGAASTAALDVARRWLVGRERLTQRDGTSGVINSQFLPDEL